ncbi:tetratricopeptide repeat protein [Tenacibaculum sp. nBUS_03]|uniref:tetratricopeptide repeat protein n=1 Tax=Tenacibaculum sp. nBUS_03 TaxID=3395320 RepID=UPI003EBF8408
MKTKINKYFFTLLIFVTFSTHINSQTSKVDSLKNELEKHTLNDTTRVHILNRLAFSYFSKDIPKTLEYLNEADSIGTVINYKKGKARSIYIRGITEVIQSNYHEAFTYYNKALKLYRSIGFKKGEANCYNAIGIAYKNKGELSTSVIYLKKAISIEKQINSDNLSASLINLGSAYDDLGDYSKSVLYFTKALSIAKANDNEQRVAYCLNNLGVVYTGQGNYPLALEYIKKGLYSNEKLGDSISIAHGLGNIAVIYKVQKHYEKGIKSYEKSLNIYQRINNQEGVLTALNGIGTIYNEKKEYKKALKNYIKALNISKQIEVKSEIPYILNNIGEVYLVLKEYTTAHKYFTEAKISSIESNIKQPLCNAYVGLSKMYFNQKEYNKALKNGLKGKEIAEKLGFLNYQAEVSETLSRVYKAMGDYKKSLENYKQFKILNDSLFNKENIEKITQIEYEYKYKQALDSANLRELQLTKTVTATNENLEKSQRNLLLGVIAFLLTLLVLGAVIFFLKLRNEKSKTQNIVIEQKLLRSQMTPHFIFNSLSVLQGMILNKEEKNSVSYLSKFSKLLRTILENSRHKTVALSEELSAIDSYMTLQNLDMNPPFEYKLKVDADIYETNFKIPPMLIQPFIENAIEHAFPSKKENKQIHVTLVFKDEKLICTIEDNGIGIDEIHKKVDKGRSSLATTITSERLTMLSKEFKTEGTIEVQNRKIFGKEGTLVTLVVPYKIELV